MSYDDDLLHEIYDIVKSSEQRLASIEAHLGIVPDLSCEITNIDESVNNFGIFCKTQLKLSDRTIKEYRSNVTKFLHFSNGEVSLEAVKVYLNSNESQSWKNQQLKALRNYCRNFLSLGSWIEGFEIINIDKLNKKDFPNDLELAEFFHALNGISQIVFLILHDSGLRIDEILKTYRSNYDFDTNCIDVQDIHEGDTKDSYLSFFTNQTHSILQTYMKDNLHYFDIDRLFLPISVRGVQIEFQRVSNDLGIQLTPKDLRTIFVTKLTEAGIKDRYINALQGRIKRKVLAIHYTDYSKDNLKKQYSKAEQLLTLPL